MSEFYDRNGEPLELMDWARLLGDEHYKIIAQDWVPARPIGKDYDGGVIMVSTVWLGLDHRWRGTGRPLIFETMIFGGDYDQFMMRYSTEHRAREVHAEIVKCVKDGKAPTAFYMEKKP